MNKVDLVREIFKLRSDNETVNANRIADFILENFVEKPKPTAVERLRDVLAGYPISVACPGHLASALLREQCAELKNIIAQFEREVETKF